METGAATRIPLRWEERNGHRWWFVTPLEWAASNGCVDVVIELLKLDASLLKDLASLTRIRRLEDLWDDDDGHFTDAAKARGLIARELILHEWSVNSEPVIEAGYGPWALYTAAAAGDMEIVQRILKRKPEVVFGDREYGPMDMLYAAARANSSEIFKEILHFVKDDYHDQPFRSNNEHIEYCRGMGIDVPFEIMNKALHAASGGGSMEILRKLVRQSSLHSRHHLNVVIWCKDRRGGTALHSAATKGHLEVVKELLSASPGAITCQDDNGNTALHVAAYSGHWGVVKELLRRLPSLLHTVNNDGNTVLHLAVGGFRACGFRCPHRHMEVIRNLISDETLNLQSIVNGKNKDGKTALHIAVISGKCTDHEKLVKLLVSAPGQDVNISDKNGMTAYDMVKATVASGLASMSLLKDLAEAGGRPMLPQSPAASQFSRTAADDTQIIRLWEQSEDDEICTEQCEFVDEYSSKTCGQLTNSKNNPGNPITKYPGKQGCGTLSEFIHGMKIKSHRPHAEDPGTRNSKANRVKSYVEDAAGFSQTVGHSRPVSPLTEQYFSASSAAGDDYYSVVSLFPSPSPSIPAPSPMGSPPVLGISKVNSKGWFHSNGKGNGAKFNGAQAVDNSTSVMSLRKHYLYHGGVDNSECQKTTSKPPLPSRRAG